MSVGWGLGLFDADRSRVGIAAVLALLLGALVLAIFDGPETQAPPSARGGADSVISAGGSDTSSTGSADALIVPTIGLDAAMIDIALEPTGVLTPPADYSEVGYWDDSAAPGSRAGQTVITGHTVHTGGGVMDRLGSVAQGDPLQVRFDGDVTDYRVRKVVVLSKAEVAEKAQALFGQDRRSGRLVLVTCTDWDGADYESNIIVFAGRSRSALPA